MDAFGASPSLDVTSSFKLISHLCYGQVRRRNGAVIVFLASSCFPGDVFVDIIRGRAHYYSLLNFIIPTRPTCGLHFMLTVLGSVS